VCKIANYSAVNYLELTQISKKYRKTKNNEFKGNRLLGISLLGVIVLLGTLAVWWGTSRASVDTGGIELPNYAYRTTEVTQGYIAAVEMPDLFDHIPCYCGCDANNHKSLKHCFYNDNGEFTQHAAGCGICIDEAKIAYTMARDNEKPIDIRKFIDDKYSIGGYPPPTNTPLPP